MLVKQSFRFGTHIAFFGLLLSLGACDKTDSSDLICSRGGFCWQMPTPQGNPLRSVSGVASRYIWAVGDAGTILHYDGQAWRRDPAETTADLYGVFCVSPKDAWAVGTEGVALHFDGISWSKVDTSVKETLRGTWGSSSSDVWMVGNRGTVLRFDGKTIKKHNANVGEDSTLYSVFGFDSEDVWIGGSRGLIRHFDGTDWKFIQHSGYYDVTAIYGPRPRDVFFGTGSSYSGRFAQLQPGGGGDDAGNVFESRNFCVVWFWEKRPVWEFRDGRAVSLRRHRMEG